MTDAPSPDSPPAGTGELLRVDDLRVQIVRGQRTVRPVDGVSLVVYPRESLGLVGESGCGKTMTALSIMRLLPPGGTIAGGSVVLTGRDLTELDARGMRGVRGCEIGYVSQDPLSSLNPTYSIGYQVAEGLRIHESVSRASARRQAAEMLDLVGLPQPRQRMDQYPHELSGGMRQRVAIAMALICRPKLLVADEPTTALDVTIQRQILELLDTLRAELDMALILITHDLGVIAGHTDRVAVMYGGKIVETASTPALFAAPRHRYTRALFAALPQAAVRDDERLMNIPGMPPDLVAPSSGCRFAPRCGHASPECVAAEPTWTRVDDAHGFSCLHPGGTDTTSARVEQISLAKPMKAAAAEPTLLGLDALVKNFSVGGHLLRPGGRRSVSAVADVSFDVRRGEVFGLVGESGCGKTTLGRMVVGLDAPTSGEISVDGVAVSALRRREVRRHRRRVQMIFQDSYEALDPRMNVSAILREPLVIHGTDGRAGQQARIRSALDSVGLPSSALDRYPHEFSGGQRQRIGLARALVLGPELIVADEPVSALDVSVQAQILNLLLDLRRDLGLSYLFVSHDLAVVRYVASRIGVMYLGKLVEIGTRDDIFERPAHPYTAGLLASMPVTDPGSRPTDRSAVRGELPSPTDPPSGCRFRTRCPLAQAVCAEVVPPMQSFADGHQAACHFPLQPVATAR